MGEEALAEVCLLAGLFRAVPESEMVVECYCFLIIIIVGGGNRAPRVLSRQNTYFGCVLLTPPTQKHGPANVAFVVVGLSGARLDMRLKAPLSQFSVCASISSWGLPAPPGPLWGCLGSV